jgi:putative two-component system response regulator
MTNMRKTIFLVDDDTTNLIVGKNVLSEKYNVVTLNSGPTLFRFLGRVKPDLILLDITMPEMSGYEVMRQLKNNPQTTEIPVIFLTALDSEETEYKGLSLGARDFVTKPFSPMLLLKRIELHLLVESQRQELVKYNNNLEEMVEEKLKTMAELKNIVLKTMAELVESRDEITGGHIDRTQCYVKVMIDAMREAGVYMDEVKTWDEALVLQSSQLHDVGKISIKDSILFKPGKLTPDEFEEIKGHTTFGEKVIHNLINSTTESGFLEYARIFAISHHEKWNGKGYPYGLAGEEIPLLGRVMAIADVYDALVTDRPYKDAFSHEEAVQIITDDSGIHFDPALVELFVNVNDKFRKISAEGIEQ